MKGNTEGNVVITGAASGIGRALSLAWAAKGWRTGITDIDMKGAAETLEMVRRGGGEGETFRCDVRKIDEVQAMAEHFFDAWGSVDVLVNNAGIAVLGFVGDTPIEEWERVMETNLWGVIYGCHCFVPRMKERGCGHIVNIASSAGIVSNAEMGPYNITKAGVISLSETLRSELAPHGIGVTAVCPMFIDTDIQHTMVYSDGWQWEVLQAACGLARMPVEEVARRIVEAVERGRLYLLPQVSGRFFWALKRISPRFFNWLFAALNKRGWLRPIFMWLSRIGWF